LGATLYELFTLEPAFPGDDPHVVIHDIATKEPVLPRRLNPAIPSDLETVLLKAMSKEPAHRYATALEMAEDLTHFLEHRPIEAKRPGLIRRASQWSRRHRTLVGATAALLLLSTAGLATGTALLWSEQAKTKSAFGSAQANLNLALQALDQIYIDEAEGRPKLREGLPKDLLQRGLEFYEKFVKANAGNQRLVALMGNAYERAGLIFRELGEEERAVESFNHAISAFDRALEIDSRDYRAHHNRGVALADLGRSEEALAAYDRAIEFDERCAAAHANRGDTLCQLKRFDEALEAYERAVEIDPKDVKAQNGCGVALQFLKRYEEALAAYDQAIKLDPRNVLIHLNRGAVLCDYLGRPVEALAEFDRALEIDPQNAMARHNRGVALSAIEVAERTAKLEGRLDQVLSGKAPPRDAVERTEFALMLYMKARHAESAQMYAEAFDDDATLTEDLVNHHRYNAACSAALAAAPGGADAVEWRGRALEWLRADLAAREKAATGLSAELEHWKVDPDFASVHGQVGDLPEPERDAWRGLWAAVDLALAAALPAAK
jgi:tetratricopeptide (TPR) repeat protein